MGPSTGLFDVGGQRLVTPPIRGRAGELKVIGALLTALVQGHGGVRVIEGPFVNFQGSIDDLNPERGKLKVMVAIFGRLTSVELEYYQVERL